MTFAGVRARFPVLERLAYLNAGTFGPLSRATLEAVTAEQRADAERGRVGPEYFERMLALREQARERLATTIGVPPADVALTTSTTEGVNVVLAGLDLGPDDEVVTTDAEHFGLIGPLAVSGARLRIAKVRDHPPERAFGAICAEVGPGARLLALSHVSWASGNHMPVSELKEATGLPVLVDGAQAAGAILVDASGFDFYTVSAQKWLCGPDSTGALFVREPDSLRLAAPNYFSQASYDLAAATFEPKEGAARFDTGWIPPASLAGLVAALDERPEWAYEHARDTSARCRELLAERFPVVTAPGQATLVVFRPDGDAAEAVARAYERGVVIRDLPGTAWARVSCGYWTSDEDLERLLAAL